MNILRFSEFRQNLAAAIDKVTTDCGAIVVTRTGGKPSAVLISLEEYESHLETRHVLASENNAARLVAALDDLTKQLSTDGI